MVMLPRGRIPGGSVELFWNPGAARGEPYPTDLESLFKGKDSAQARACVSAWPGYEATPLRSLPGNAMSAGVGALWYKDESGRFGLGSFKALGGAYAVARVLADELGVDEAALMRGEHRSETGSFTMACASDGNHGKSVAWAASLTGCRAVVYLSDPVPAVRVEAIRELGAEVVVVAGSYEDAVARCVADAESNDWWLMTDSAWAGHEELPRYVMEGYTVLVAEALEQLPPESELTHVFVQGGVGGLAGAVCAHLWDALGGARPLLIVVESQAAACLQESARAGALGSLEAVEETVMTGLACGTPSSLAWRVLDTGADAYVSISDLHTSDAMRALAGGAGDPPVVAGASGAAGLGAVRAIASDQPAREALGLSRQSTVLVIGTEGASDPALYRRTVGRTAEQILSQPA
jgi:diaminopropionate ammonia-lyase